MSHPEADGDESPCAFCGYVFNQHELGRYGCPNCLGEGQDQGQRWTSEQQKAAP